MCGNLKHVHKVDNYPETALGDARATGGAGDVGWVLGVGLAPLLGLALTMPAVVIMDHRGGLLSEVLSNWNLYAVFGLVIFAPIMVISCIGALIMISKFSIGRWISTAGSAAMIACMSLLIYAGARDLVAPTSGVDPIGWISVLTPVGTLLFVAPYLVLLAANIYVVCRLWRLHLVRVLRT